MATIVENVITHLREISETMKQDEANFKQDDIDHCDRIAVHLQELEIEVKRLREEYEAETIKSSVLRHKLTNFPNELNNEIESNVKAARDSNMAVIIDLKEKLDILTKNIQSLRKREKELLDQIAQMSEEKKSYDHRHESVIKSLNQQMANKADYQIKLNEARDLLREINKKILDMEEEMLKLKEQLLKEKAEAREKKGKLEAIKYNTNKKAELQEEANEAKKNELDGVLKVLDESNKSLRTVYRENERFEKQIADITVEIDERNKQFMNQQFVHDSLQAEGLRLTALDAQTRQDFAKNKADTIQNTKDAGERSKVEAENLKKLKEVTELKRDELKDIYKVYKDLTAEVEEIKKILDFMRDDIGKKLQHIAELDAQNIRIQQELESSQDSHNMVMDSMQREAEELREQLAHERDLRIKKQQEREAKLKEIEKFNEGVSVAQSIAIKYMSDSKFRHKQLTDREKFLNEEIRKNEEEIKRLKAEVDITLSEYNEMKSKLEGLVNKLETEIAFYDTEVVKNQTEIDELTPSYNELCNVFAQKTSEYDDVRQKLIKTKNHKAHLETTIKKTKEETVSHDSSRDKISEDLAAKRASYLLQMKGQSTELETIENQILQTGLRMQTIKYENDKFIDAIKEFEIQFKYFETFGSENNQDIETLQAEYASLHRKLIEGWKSDHETEKLFEVEDLELVERLTSLLNLTNNRENKVSDVTDKLYVELESMSNHLRQMIGKIESEKQDEENALKSEQVEIKLNDSN